MLNENIILYTGQGTRHWDIPLSVMLCNEEVECFISIKILADLCLIIRLTFFTVFHRIAMHAELGWGGGVKRLEMLLSYSFFSQLTISLLNIIAWIHKEGWLIQCDNRREMLHFMQLFLLIVRVAIARCSFHIGLLRTMVGQHGSEKKKTKQEEWSESWRREETIKTRNEWNIIRRKWRMRNKMHAMKVVYYV